MFRIWVTVPSVVLVWTVVSPNVHVPVTYSGPAPSVIGTEAGACAGASVGAVVRAGVGVAAADPQAAVPPAITRIAIAFVKERILDSSLS
jgi:hypothetical protein